MKTLILGCGEIGKSLGAVLSNFYEVVYKDKDDRVDGEFDVINICYPYSKNFIKITKEYIDKYKPKLTIIHSTIPVGTTRLMGKGVIHSPVNGKHPNLSKSILTFTKFIGANNAIDGYEAEEFLKKAGIKVSHFACSEETELAKILCTTYYGWNIVFMKEVIKLCAQYNVNFLDVYTLWNNAYNKGYEEMGEPQFRRPILKPMRGKIGGHCVLPNCELLESFVTDIVKHYEN